jgi:hypothetical protein
MADYHPLIARAVAGLEKNTGENRRALYERARTALVAQLRGVVPALDESEITRERLALEEAIRKVEAESARHARETARPAFVKRAEIPRREDKSRPSSPSAPPPASSAPPAPEPTVEPEPEPPAPPPVSRRPTPRTMSAPRSLSEPSSPRPAPQAGSAGASRPSSRGSRTLQDEALRGFRGVADDPNATTARQPPRDEHSGANLPPAPTLERHPLEEYGQLEPQVQPENLWAQPYGTPPDSPDDFGRPQPAEPAYDTHDDRGGDGGSKPPRPPRSYAGLIRTALVLLLVMAVGGLAYWQRAGIAHVAGSVVAFFHSPSPQQQPREASRAQPKITDRLGQPSTQPSSGPPVAQRVVLYEEDPDDPQGKRFVGTVLWRTEMKPAAPGRPSELAVRADIEVPERKMSVAWSLRRNTDQSLPASHTIEIVFNLPTDTPSGGVQNVPGVLMKQSESTRGVPLAGLAVKVTPGFFLIGLSSLEADMQRNIQLLKERPWFDIPIVYNNNRRAILAMEKGTPGEKAFAEAFAAWKQ